MADAPKIFETDSLRNAFPKLNQAIDNSNEALSKSTTAETNSTTAISTSNNAVQIAENAESTAESVQTQFNQVVIEGDSSVEAAQARVDAEGTTFTTLKERLDNGDAQLTETSNFVKEVDFVKLLQDHNDTSGDLKVRVLGDRIFGVAIPFKGTKHFYASFKKDTADDYVRMGTGAVYEIGDNLRTGGKNWDSYTGTLNTSTPNSFMATVGGTITVTFEGTGLDFMHYADNRGGLWEFVIDGDTTNKVQVSVWAEGTPASNQWKTVEIARGLSEGTHTLIMTFLGADPANPGGTRGWIYNHSATDTTENYPFITYNSKDVQLFNVIDSASVKEFAFSARSANNVTQLSEWLPQHGTVGTVFEESQKVYFDDKENTNWSVRDGITAKSVKIEQQLLGYNPADMVNPLCRIYAVHTITGKGVSVKHTFVALQDMYIGTGYPMMFPTVGTFSKQLITSLKEIKPTVLSDGSRPPIQGYPTSFAFTNNTDDAMKNYVCAMTVDDYYSTYLMNKERNEFMFLEHRTDGLQKVYIPTFENHTMLTGEKFTMGGTYYIGELPFASEMLV